MVTAGARGGTTSLAVEIVVEGMVQGVGFRQFAQTCARKGAVVGYAMNAPDGTVRVVAEGARAALETFIADLERGPRLGRVARVDVAWRARARGVHRLRHQVSRTRRVVRALVAAGLLVTLIPALALSAPPEPRKPAVKPAAAKPPLARQKPIQDPAPPERVAPTPPSGPLVHEVQHGETLGAIARQYQVTVTSIVIANRLRGPRARLQEGQLLKIPRSRAAPVLPVRRGPVVEPLPVSLVLSVPDFEDPPSFQWPIAGPVTSTFGRRSRSWHRGIDIAAEPGAPIVAAAAGLVIASGVEPRYGQMVKIEHDGGFLTVYAHNERNLVEVGQVVVAGQTIALAGRTGRATGRARALRDPPRRARLQPALSAPAAAALRARGADVRLVRRRR